MVLVKGQVIEAERRKERRAERRRCKCFNGLMVLNAYFAVEHATNAVRTKKIFAVRRSIRRSPCMAFVAFLILELNQRTQL